MFGAFACTEASAKVYGGYNTPTIFTACGLYIYRSENRVQRHNKGQVHYTKNKLPIELITYIAFSDKYKAYNFEKYLQQMTNPPSGHKKALKNP